MRAGTLLPPELAAFDLTDLDNFAAGFPHAVFEVHRREVPVFWHEPTEHTPGGEGFWSAARMEDALEILRDPGTFSSETGGGRPYGGTVLTDLPVAGRMLNMMDEPRHGRMRRLVSRGFTPRTVARLEEDVRSRTRERVRALAGAGPFDFVAEVAREIPLQMICGLMGIPEADRHEVESWISPAFDFKEGAEYDASPAMQEANANLFRYGVEAIEARRRQPGEDLLSVVVRAELEGEEPPSLSNEELMFFFTLLFAAGAETTRNATSGGLLALMDHPDQWAVLEAERAAVSSAVEEIVRWTSSAAYNRRTATRDAELGGLPIAAGDKVVFWEASANRDEAAFADPARFDVRRDPNPHIGFGAGVHFCLGASLARLEIRVLLEEALDAWAEVHPAGEPEWVRSNKHTGLRRLPVRAVAA